ncbi:unnamed protein product [Urochloa humidicola]
MPSSPAHAVDAGRSSASTIAADTETGSHELTISGYSGTKGLGVGKFICSSVFSAGGHSWCIRYYPDGLDQDRSDWPIAYLCLLYDKAMRVTMSRRDLDSVY